MPALQLHGKARTVAAPPDADARLSARARAEYQDGNPDLFDAVYGADLLAQHHGLVADYPARNHRDLLGVALERLACVLSAAETRATLTGSASAAHVASPADGIAPLLTSGRSVRGPGLLGTS